MSVSQQGVGRADALHQPPLALDLDERVAREGFLQVVTGQDVRDDGVCAEGEGQDCNVGCARVGVADLDGDDDLDVVTSFVNVLLNNGDGTLAPPVPYAVGGNPFLAIGDLDGADGPDLAVTKQDGVSVLFNIGNGTFLPPEFHVAAPGHSSVAVAIADLDGITGHDLVVDGGVLVRSNVIDV